MEVSFNSILRTPTLHNDRTSWVLYFLYRYNSYYNYLLQKKYDRVAIISVLALRTNVFFLVYKVNQYFFPKIKAMLVNLIIYIILSLAVEVQRQPWPTSEIGFHSFWSEHCYGIVLSHFEITQYVYLFVNKNLLHGSFACKTRKYQLNKPCSASIPWNLTVLHNPVHHSK